MAGRRTSQQAGPSLLQIVVILEAAFLEDGAGKLVRDGLCGQPGGPDLLGRPYEQLRLVGKPPIANHVA